MHGVLNVKLWITVELFLRLCETPSFIVAFKPLVRFSGQMFTYDIFSYNFFKIGFTNLSIYFKF